MGLGQRGVRRLLRVLSKGWFSLRDGYTNAVVSGARLLLTQFPLKDGHRALSSEGLCFDCRPRLRLVFLAFVFLAFVLVRQVLVDATAYLLVELCSV